MEYLKRDIAKQIKESPRKVQYWTDFGLVIPDINSAGGKGISKIYSERNLVEFGIIQIMRDHCNLPLTMMKIILSGLRKGYHKKEQFKDFYSSEEWGKSKELIFIGHGFAGSGPCGFHVIKKTEYGIYELPMSGLSFSHAIKNAKIFTTAMLGKIKIEAKKSLKQ